MEKSNFPSDTELGDLAGLVKKQLRLEFAVEVLETDLSKAQRELEQMRSETIPEKMNEFGISELELDSGEKVALKPFYYGSISEDNREVCLAWLIKNGHADIIKHLVICSFTKGEARQVRELRRVLKNARQVFTDTESVHASTLKAFIREQIEAGNAFPLEMFKAGVVQRTTIKRRNV